MDNLKDIDLKQSWWHIEDEIEPSDGRLVYRVQDYYIEKDFFEKNNYIRVPVGAFFVGFKARNKNSGNELSFIADYNQINDEESTTEIRINLGCSSDWPKVGNSNYLHVKVQYEYIDFWPLFEKRLTYPLGIKIPPKNEDEQFDVLLPKSIKDRLKLLRHSGYKGQFIMLGDSQGELSISVPLGMELTGRGNNTKIILYSGPVQRDTPQTELSYDKPHIICNENKLKYNYIIDGESYDYVLKTINENPEIDVYYLVCYDVVNDGKFFLVPTLSALIFLLIWLGDWNASNVYYFAVILLSLSTLYLTLRKEKYQIPLNRFVFVSIPLSGILIFIKLYYDVIIKFIVAIITPLAPAILEFLKYLIILLLSPFPI